MNACKFHGGLLYFCLCFLQCGYFFIYTGVTDTAVVERGRNVVSVARDGTAKLWDVGQKTCLATMSELGGIINGCDLGSAPTSLTLGTPEEPASEFGNQI